MRITEVIYPEVARSLGFVALTVPYTVDERWMLTRAVDTLKATARKFLIVASGGGHEIWIPKSDIKTTGQY
jgi:hypothetical protein